MIWDNIFMTCRHYATCMGAHKYNFRRKRNGHCKLLRVFHTPMLLIIMISIKLQLDRYFSRPGQIAVMGTHGYMAKFIFNKERLIQQMLKCVFHFHYIIIVFMENINSSMTSIISIYSFRTHGEVIIIKC